MLRKRIFEILSVLVAVIIAFSCCCISASAATTYNFSCSQPQLQGTDCYVEFVTDKGIAGVVYVKAVLAPNLSSTTLNVSFTARVIDNYLEIGLNPSSYSFDGEQMEITVRGLYYLDFGEFGATAVVDSHSLLSLSQIGNIIAIRSYNCNVSDIGVPNGDFVFAYGNEININNKLDTIIGALQGGNQQIIDNQDKNTDKVIQNQEQNQEEIKNGWQQENQIDSSATDDYAAKDKELQAATDMGRSEAVSVFNSFGSLFQSDGHLYKGLLSVSAMFTEFMKIDWLSSLLNFSLAIGIFAFVIGTGSSIFRSAHEKFGSKSRSEREVE